MNVFKIIESVLETDLINQNLKWCFINSNKIPFNNLNQNARVNNVNDFINFNEILTNDITSYNFQGLGINVNFSNITAIDLDKCFSIPFDINSGDIRASDFLERFKNHYVEFSFSGTGLRVLFFTDKNDIKDFENYKNNYYIKNSTKNVEIYFPFFSYRYVSITGQYIYNNKITKINDYIINRFLFDYMRKNNQTKQVITEHKTTLKDQPQEVKKKLLQLFHKNNYFLSLYCGDLVYNHKSQSELDYYLIITLLNNVSNDNETIKALIEDSEFFKQKDAKHLKKWNNTDYFYNTVNKIKNNQ